MKKILSTVLVSIILYGLLFTPVMAQGGPIWGGRNPVECNQPDKGPCEPCDALKVATNIVDFLIEIALVIGALMIVYGAILMMVSAGSQERYRKGKSAVTSAFIGVFIALTSCIIINTILHVLACEAAFPWAKIACYNNTYETTHRYRFYSSSLWNVLWNDDCSKRRTIRRDFSL